MKVINLYGGPGSGKSTTAALVFSSLKLRGINCELIQEYAKELTWEERLENFDDELYIFAEQRHRLIRLKDKVDYVVTDCPLLMKLSYIPEDALEIPFIDLVIKAHNEFDNMEIFVNRVKPYLAKGRTQTEDEAKLKDHQILGYLKQYTRKYSIVNGDGQAAINVLKELFLN